MGVSSKRGNGNGCIVRRGASFSLRRVNPVTGKMTMAVLRNPDGAKCATMAEAEKAAKTLNEEMRELDGIRDRERAIVELAKARRFMASLEHTPGEMWELFRKSPAFNASMSARRLRQLEKAVGSYVVFCKEEGLADCSKMTGESVERWLAKTCGGMSNRTFNEYLADIRQVFGAVHRTLGLDRNPAADIRARKRQTVGREAFTLEQMQAIMDCFDKGFFARRTYQVPCGHGDAKRMEKREVSAEYRPGHLEEMRLAVMLGFMAGCRLADACTLKWSNVDLDGRMLRYTPRKTAKSSGMAVTVPIVDKRLLAALAAADHSGEYVTPALAEWHGRNASTLARTFERLFACATGMGDGEKGEGRARRASLHGFHALRHTFVSFCANAGISLEICASIVGHSTVSTTQIYSHISDAAKRQALAQVAGGDGDRDGERDCLIEWARTADSEKVRRLWEIARML